MIPVSPTVASWELAIRLRSRRKELSIDVPTITRVLGFTRNYWSAVENDRTILAEEKLLVVADLLAFNKAETDELLQLRESARERSWWHIDLVSTELQQLYGLEYGAHRIRNFEGCVVNGLLQTSSYARALISSSPLVRPTDVESLVAIRIKRQEQLASENSADLIAVMSEASLLQHVGPPIILLDQIRHLEGIIHSRSPTVKVRVIPLTRPHGGLVGVSTLHILDFDSPHLPSVAWAETPVVLGLTEDPVLMRFISLAYEQALEAALSPEDSLVMIEQCARDLERQIKRGDWN